MHHNVFSQVKFQQASKKISFFEKSKIKSTFGTDILLLHNYIAWTNKQF